MRNAWLLVTILSWHNVLADWEDWSDWTSCSVTCGTGYHVRSRACADGASDCTGLNHETKHCAADTPCAVDGEWGNWASWHECSVTCGSGYKYRGRHCDNPPPQYGGVSCSGSENDIQLCSKSLCPVDGGWSEWDAYSACTTSCGYNAVKQRSRFCMNPVPANGGAGCTGHDNMTATCPYINCLDGVWAVWSHWSQCSATCGTSVRFKLRNCTVSVNNGTCKGNTYESGICSTECPVNGGWSNWGHWSVCKSSNSCGTGSRDRRRQCANPAPAHGGKQCSGVSNELQGCTIPCPVNGHWSAWIITGTCSKTCGQGAEIRKRDCSNPPASHGGLPCSGSSIQSVACNEAACPVNGHWSAWIITGTCSKTCGQGAEIRKRDCSNPPASHGGLPCSGFSLQSVACNEAACPVDGHWGTWGPYGSCSVTCGTGHHTRTRKCDSPAPAHGGHNCVGSSHDTGTCHKTACPQAACPSSTWVRHRTSCYYISNGAHTWAYSGNWCSGYHATLVKIDGRSEQRFLVTAIKQKYGTAAHSFWLDGEDKLNDGHWVWHASKQSVTYTHWQAGQPDGGTVEDCMAMLSSAGYQWADKPCATNFLYICEKKDSTAGTTLIG